MEKTTNIAFGHVKKNPFTVPSGYFDDLPRRINQQIDLMEENRKPRFMGLSLKKLSPQLALAASFILMIGLGYGIVRLITPKKTETDPLAIEVYFSRFDAYTLLNSADDLDDTIDSEQIIAFLTERGISPYAIASLE